MKTILKLISIAIFMVYSSFALAQATGEDPNLAKSSNSQAGTMVTGADLNAQVAVCKKCQNRNNLKLSDQKDNSAVPAVKSESSSGNSSTEDGRK